MSDAAGSAPANAADPANTASSTGSPLQGGFNLSSWTLGHQALVIFMLVMVTLFGVLSYGKLAQSEDPPFTFKVMVIQHASGPAPTARTGAGRSDRPDRAQAAGDARRRFSAQLLAAGRVDSCSSPSRIPRRPARGAGHLVPGAQESRRHRLHAALAEFRDRTSTTSSATSTRISTRWKATAFRRRSCMTTPSGCAPNCCACPASTRWTSSPTRNSASTSRSRTRSCEARSHAAADRRRR